MINENLYKKIEYRCEDIDTCLKVLDEGVGNGFYIFIENGKIYYLDK